MNRGDALQWGIQIDTDGKRWNVMLVGSQRAGWTFDTFSALVEWLEEENEGLQIGRMKGADTQTPTVYELTPEGVTGRPREPGDMRPVWNQPVPLGVIKAPESCTCPAAPFPPRPGCPVHHPIDGGSNA